MIGQELAQAAIAAAVLFWRGGVGQCPQAPGESLNSAVTHGAAIEEGVDRDVSSLAEGGEPTHLKAHFDQTLDATP